MAKNLFDKYGIKEVADVTFYRIERKDETYEAQRKISVSSILKGALELATVYPMINGVGGEEGFEAYVFPRAEILTHRNYNCDDTQYTIETLIYSTTVASKPDASTVTIDKDAYSKIVSEAEGYSVIKHSIVDSEFGKSITKDSLKGYTVSEVNKIALTELNTIENETDEVSEPVTYTITYKAELKVKYEGESTEVDADKTPGTHEYTYEDQILMLFAKNQNLIDKTGVRYQFKDGAIIFGNIAFNDDFSSAPNSTEKIVVAGIAGRFSANAYDVDEVKEEIKNLHTFYSAKAYNVTYTDYAELIVEDEMGYYNQNFLAAGNSYKRNDNGSASVTHFTTDSTYKTYATANNGIDYAIANATMWGAAEHESINDAIEALKQKKKIIDASADSKLTGLNRIYGGYKVNSTHPEAGSTDLSNEYSYTVGGVTGNYKSLYSLEKVIEQLNVIATADSSIGKDVKVTQGTNASNRAIYVKVDGSVDTAAGAYIYLLKNKNVKRLSSDTDGIFQFDDKKGNTLFYQDKIFAGVETLALVIIGNKGLIFVVNRYGTKNFEKVAWMINNNGYITNTQAKLLVKNGLIHTVDTTVNDETFEATCTVGGIKIRKIQKRVNRYVPVLFLDTLKVSTIEQTAETTYATGGRGNANLIGWDFNKEITLTLQDALYTPASMSAMLGSYEGNDFTSGVKDTKKIDRMEKCIAKRSFIVPAGNSDGVPSEGEQSPQAVYIEIATMKPYQDGAPIAEGEVYLKWTRSIAYGDNSLGNTIEISAEKFPGTYKIVGDTFARSEATGEDQRFQFVVPKAKISPESTTITLEAEGDPTVFDLTLTVLRPEDGIMMKLIQYDVVENVEENDGSTMVKDTENLNLLDDAEMFKVNADAEDEELVIGATEY